jgi:hypothetical protein
MVNLLDNWTLDRSPGIGKAIDSTGSSGVPNANVGGIIGLGVPSIVPSVPATYAPLPEPGTTIPAPGNPNRSGFFLAFKEAVGFDGKTSLYGLPLPTNATSFSLSTWVNFGDLAVGYPSNPGQGLLFGTPLSIGYGAGIGNALFVEPGDAFSSENSGPQFVANQNNDNMYWDIFSSGNTSQGQVGTTITYPGNSTTNAGWFHLMMSIRVKSATSIDASIWVNDTLCLQSNFLLDTLTAGNVYNPNFASSTAQFTNGGGNIEEVNIGGPGINYIGGQYGSRPSGGDGLKGAVTEYWARWGSYIDWSVQANRYKFHVTDGNGSFQTWAPCNLGSTGAAPGFGVPTVYLSGGSSLFFKNRATGGAALGVYAGGFGLFDVDDPPT